jgi:uncharacterized protein YjiS (DUF1127 family)
MKEAAMPAIDKHGFSHAGFRPLTPDEQHRIVREAKAERARAVRFLCRLLARRLGRATAQQWRAVRDFTLDVGVTVAALRRSYAEWRRHRLAVAELEMLRDGALKDIGVCRSEIEWVARYGRFTPRTVRMERAARPAESANAMPSETARAAPQRRAA